MSQVERVHPLQATPIQLNKKYIAYWCCLSLRASQNHALEYAIHLANKHTLPLVVFTTVDNTQTFSARHLLFEMESKKELALALEKKEIGCVHLLGNLNALLSFIIQDAIALIMDATYLKEQKLIEPDIMAQSTCPIIKVESNVVVPVNAASQKSEYGAYTLRPKIHRMLDRFLVPITEQSIETPSVNFTHNLFSHGPHRITLKKKAHQFLILEHNELCNHECLNKHLSINWNIAGVQINDNVVQGGEGEAHNILEFFLQNHFMHYAALGRDPSVNEGLGMTSGMSPYLRLGIISPLQIVFKSKEYLTVLHLEHPTLHDEIEESYLKFFEELVVRRELAYNFTHYHNHYDQYQGLPEWARNTLDEHKEDFRPVIYSKETMEQAQTQDPYWNAAQLQLLKTGNMHGYMRMYWGKKILEWMEDPADAFNFALYLNNTYSIDAPDPSSFAGAAWCFGTHDRPHPQRAIFGTVRYMNANGLRRKFDIDVYVNKWTQS